MPNHIVMPMGADAAPSTSSSLLESPIVPKAAMVLSAYHGLRRNHGSILWGAIWGVAGHFMPLLVPTFALAQGYAKPKTCGGS